MAGFWLGSACYGVCVVGFGVCSSIGRELWDAAWLRGLLWLWVVHCFPGDDIMLDGVVMLSSSMVLFSVGLNGIALGDQGLVDYGVGDV